MIDVIRLILIAINSICIICKEETRQGRTFGLNVDSLFDLVQSAMIVAGNIKKRIGKGLMDCAFLVADCNQLRNAYSSAESVQRTTSIVLMFLSISFQVREK